MRIVLHIGPHKTGTTSIQTHLGAVLGEPVAGGYWYPVPEGRGPGHADLARACLREGRPVTELDRVIAVAQEAKVGTLVLSSEEFAHAFPGRLARLKNALEGYEIHLVVTLNEIERRTASVWQELVKSGHVVGREEGIEQSLSRQPALQPQLTRAFIDALAPHQTSVVLSHHRAPAAELLTNVCRALGLFEAAPETEAATSASTLVLNQSLGVTETEILRSVNSWIHQAVGDLSTIPYTAIRNLYLNLFNTPAWRNSVPLRPITIPPAHMAEVLNRGRREIDDLKKLADEGRARLHGDLDTVEGALVTVSSVPLVATATGKRMLLSSNDSQALRGGNRETPVPFQHFGLSMTAAVQTLRTLVVHRPGKVARILGKETLVVCGAQRGNTSMVAFSLYNLGCFLGERLGELNYEDRDILRLLPDPTVKAEFSESNFQEFVAARNSKYARWGFKLPHASGYVPELAAMLRNPLFIICFRSTIGNIRSISNRESHEVSIERMLTVASQPVKAALNVIQHTDAPAILVDTEAAIATPGVFLQEISGTLGLHGDLAGIRDAIAKRGYKPSIPRDGVTFSAQ